MKICLCLIGLISAFGITMLFAGVPVSDDHHGAMIKAHAHLHDMLERLGITEEQKSEIINLIKAKHEKIQEQFSRLHVLRAALFARIHAEVFDEMAVRQAFRKVAAVEEDFAVFQATIAQEIYTVLTPEQLVLVREMIQEWQSKIEKGMDAHHDIKGRFMQFHEGDPDHLEKMMKHIHDLHREGTGRGHQEHGGGDQGHRDG